MAMLAFIVLALAVSVRQSSLIFLILSPFYRDKRFAPAKLRILVFVFSLMIALFTAWASDHWLVTREVQPGVVSTDYDLVRLAHANTIQKILFSAPDMAILSIAAIGHVLCYLSLFCLPALPVLVSVIVSRRKALGISLKLTFVSSFFVVASALICILFCRDTKPFSENILRFTTIGAQGLLGIIRQPLSPSSRMAITIASFVMALPLTISLGWLFSKCLQKPIEWRVPALAVAGCGSILFLTLETLVRCTDRYYLIALAPTLLVIGFISKRAKKSVINPISIVLLIGLSCYSLCCNQEYLSSNRARWKAIEWLDGRGISSSLVDGGYEYNVVRDANVYNSKNRGKPPRDSWRWWPIKGETYIVSLSPVPGYKTIHVEPYFSLVDRKTRNIEVLESLPLEAH
jgi:hypothetical protein